jgi:hypothetical protein
LLTTNYSRVRRSWLVTAAVTQSGTQSFAHMFWSPRTTRSTPNSCRESAPGHDKYTAQLQSPTASRLGWWTDLHSRSFNSSKQQLFFFWGHEWQRDATVEEQTGLVPTAMRTATSVAAEPPQTRTSTARLHQRSADRSAVPVQRDSTSAAERAGPRCECVPAPDRRLPAGASNWIGNPSVFNNHAITEQDRLWSHDLIIARRAPHLGAECLERNPDSMACTLPSGLPGSDPRGHLTITLSSSHADQTISRFCGADDREILRSEKHATIAGWYRRVSLSDKHVSRHHLSVYLSPHQAGPEKVPNVSMTGFTQSTTQPIRTVERHSCSCGRYNVPRISPAITRSRLCLSIVAIGMNDTDITSSRSAGHNQSEWIVSVH